MIPEHEAPPEELDADDVLDPGEVGRQFLDQLLATMELEASIEVSQRDGAFHLEIQGPDVALLIGRQGSTLGALQYLLTLIVSKKVGQRIRLVLDAEGYRSRREEDLRETARSWAEKVKETGQECVLDPMPAYERRVVHTALAEDPEIYTYSEGEEPERCVVISPRTEEAEEPAEEPAEEQAEAE